jgi:hypothetical protein
MKKKPTAAVPLSKASMRPADPITICNVCASSSDSLAVWREHDLRDQPIEGVDALVFIGKDHPACIKVMEAHPLLYAEVRGDPGTFPRLCGNCELRRGVTCTHPDLKANGGPGLTVKLDNPLRGVIICGSRGRLTVVNHALSCTGRKAP